MQASDLFKDQRVVLGVVGVAAVAWACWAAMGSAPSVSLDERISGGSGYNPWMHWRTTNDGLAATRWYPDTVAPNCLPNPLANQDSSISTGASHGW